MQSALLAVKALVDKLPHWLILVLASGVGACLSYFQAEPTQTLFAALTNWELLKPLLAGAGMAFFGTVIALLKTAPWSTPDGNVSVARVPPLPALLFVLALGTILVAACLTPPTPAQQEAAAAELAACIAGDWGKPPPVVAADCTQGEVLVAEDAIADFEALLEKRTAAADGGLAAPAPFPYAGNLAIETRLSAARLQLQQGR